MQIYNTILKPFLENQIIVNWIAPIITGLVLLSIPPIITQFIKNQTLIKNINLINNKIIDTIRPFIIQRIEIDSKFISNIRQSILKDTTIKEKYIYNELEIRNKILLDISETRFLKETEKYDLINFTNKIFRDFDEKLINEKRKKEKITKERLQLIKLLIFFSIISTLVIILIITIVQRKKSNLFYYCIFYYLYFIHIHFYKPKH